MPEEAIRQTDKTGIVELHIATGKNNERAIRLYREHAFPKGYLTLEHVRKVRPKEV
ncbi:MAG: hypothetical protein JSW19_04130 [Candidatus Bathyarchaeota archaeon]|nr:MAG: hypothetical protein JSW19_04130 [Candidatus Bathyarchaeota archaeon]